MAENFSQLPPNSTGEKIRLFENTVGLNDVNSEAVTVTDQTGQVMKNMGANGRIFVDASEVAVPITDNNGSITVDGTVTANAGTGPFPVSDNGGSLTVDGSVTAIAQPGVDIGDVTVNNSAGAGAVNIQDGGNSITVDGTVAATQDGPWTVQPGNTANTTPWLVTNRPATSGGYSVHRDIDLDEATGSGTTSIVKASAGQVFGWFIYNNANQTRYVKIYNTSVAPVVGTTIPVLTIPIPGGAAANVEFSNGIAFSTGISWAATTGVADTDTGAPGTNDVVANLFYK